MGGLAATTRRAALRCTHGKKISLRALSATLRLPAHGARRRPAASTPLLSAHPVSSQVIVLFLALLLGIQPVTTDLYLPALPALRASLGASMAQVQLTLTALLLAFGFSQLVWGPLSDRFGRRPILLWGTGLYVLSACVGALAPNIEVLIFCRAVQGVGLGAAVVCARALVRDVYQPVEAAQAMSRGLSGLGVIACLSAPLGGAMATLFGWRMALALPAVFGVVLWLLLSDRFRETVTRLNLDALRPRDLWRNWSHIAGNHAFRANSVQSAASYGALFTYLATSSFVFIQVLGWSIAGYGGALFLMSLIYIFGTLWCRRLVVRRGVRRAVALASGFTLASGLLMAALAYAGFGQPWYGGWAVLLPLSLFMLAHGVHQPCSQSGAVAPFPQMAGAASALNGVLTTVVAFVTGGWLGQAMDGTVFPLVYAFGFWTLCIAINGLTAVQRHG